MTAERPAKRYPASAFPGITGVRVAPPDEAATLVNLSETGALVECGARRPPLDGSVKVYFAGTFTPASVQARVVRCEVAGISPNGALRYHLGLTFTARITLPAEVEHASDAKASDGAEPELVAVAASVGAPAAAAPASAPILRNRW